jgi:hypothetical protein
MVHHSTTVQYTYQVRRAGSTYQILVGGALVPGYPAGQLHVRALGAPPPPARARQPPLNNERAQRAEHVRRLEAGRALVLRRQTLAAAVGAAGASAATAAWKKTISFIFKNW